MMNSLQLVPSTPAMAVAPRSASYLGLAGTGMVSETFGRDHFVTTAICDHAKSVVRSWTANPAATKNYSQWESPT